MPTVDPGLHDLDARVEEFEARLAAGSVSLADVNDYLPVVGDSARSELLVELLRVTLEHEWAAGRKPLVDEYLAAFPEVRSRCELLAPLAFEEYRLRVQDGQPVTPADYAQRFSLDVVSWPALSPQEERWRSFAESSPLAAERLEQACRALPDVGKEFAEFELVAELGRGAFARVFLARQPSLAGRLVALKITAGPTGEPRRLARLQHGNVVPVYSVHAQGPLTGVCMPYLGNSTLADVVRGVWRVGRVRREAPRSGKSIVSTLAARRSLVSTLPGATSVPLDPLPTSPTARLLDQLESGSYVEAVVRLLARVAEGLAHAHDRGILHRDLKPANILLADDGEPLILDFNLATESTPEAGGLAIIGGTLPYMAPEQLAALATGHAREVVSHEPRSDLFSLGVVLFELLTGQLPHDVSRGSVDEITAGLRRAWTTEIPSVRDRNPAVSRGLEAIVRQCLAPNLAQRYLSAHDLADDLTRHLASLPLRHAAEPWSRERIVKWTRRHPRLTSASTVGAAALLLLGVLGGAWFARGRQIEQNSAANQLQAFEAALPEARVLLAPGVQAAAPQIAERGAVRAREVLAVYQVLEDPNWEQRADVRLLDAGSRERLRSEALELTQLLAAASAAPTSAAPMSAARETNGASSSPVMPLVEAMEQCGRGAYERADSLLRGMLERNPRDAAAWLALGYCHVRRNDLTQADVDYSMCHSLVPGLYAPVYFRGLARLEMKRFAQARLDFSKTLELQPGFADAHFHRALAAQGMGEHKAAIDDFTAAIALGLAHTRTYFLRARSHVAVGDPAAAQRDRDDGMRLEPGDEPSYVARGLERLTRDPAGAESDFRAALRLDPASATARANLAHVLSERLGKTDEAIACLGAWIERHPLDALPRGSRAVLHARRGDSAAAEPDAEEALRLSPAPFTRYQVGCVYALLAKQRPEMAERARGLLAKALDEQPALALEMRRDPDLIALRDDGRFQRLLAAALLLVAEGASKEPTGNGSQ